MPDVVISPMKAVVYRKAQSKYQMDFTEFFVNLNVQELISITQSESDGNVTATIIYR
jgi:hypothetical protein